MTENLESRVQALPPSWARFQAAIMGRSVYTPIPITYCVASHGLTAYDCDLRHSLSVAMGALRQDPTASDESHSNAIKQRSFC